MNKRILLLGLAATMPALAGGDGFTVGLKSGLMKANTQSPMITGSYSTYASLGGVNTYTYNNAFAEFGDHTPIGLTLGFNHGDNSFTMDYFGSRKKKSTDFNYAYTSFGGSGSGGGNGYGIVGFDTGTTETLLDASILDLKWVHRFSMGNNGGFNTTLGIRAAEFKANLGQTGYDLGNTAYHGTLFSENTTKAYGLIGGLGYTYPIGGGFSAGMDLTFAFLQGKDESSTKLYRNEGGTLYSYTYTGDAKSQTYSQQDFLAHVDWKIVAGLELSLGYRYQNFGKVNKVSSTPYYNTNSETAGGWGLSGLQLGVSYTF